MTASTISLGHSIDRERPDLWLHEMPNSQRLSAFVFSRLDNTTVIICPRRKWGNGRERFFRVGQPLDAQVPQPTMLRPVR